MAPPGGGRGVGSHKGKPASQRAFWNAKQQKHLRLQVTPSLAVTQGPNATHLLCLKA